MATVRRERRLPPGAVGEALVEPGATVDPATPVLRGAMPGQIVMVDALKPLRLKKPEQIETEKMLQVQLGEVVDEGQPILAIGEGRRAKYVESPLRAIFVRIEGGTVILQADPQPIEILALSPGIVTSVRGDSVVVVESIGAFVQGVWGNGKSVFAPIALEPEGGLEQQEESLLQEFKGVALLMRNAVKSPTLFTVAIQHGVKAIIAPSMSARLRETALRQQIPILLAEGFGEMRMSDVVYTLLKGNVNRPATIDAVEPTPWSADRPEIFVPLASGGSKPRAPEREMALVEGAMVRLTRAPYQGQTGRVVRIIDSPRAVENSLRLAGADVQLTDSKTDNQVVFAPLANLELLGRPI